MRCSKIRRYISDDIDRQLTAAKRAQLERHLERCPGCRKLRDDLQRIVDSAGKLETLTPSEKAWLGIRDKLEARDQQVLAFKPRKHGLFGSLFYPPRLRYVMSFAVLLAFVIGAAVLGLRYWTGKGVLSEEKLQKYTLTKLDEAEHHYQKAIKALWQALSAQEENGDPLVAEILTRNLEVVDSSIAICRRTVLENPEDIEARNFLLAAYRKKVDFLNEMMVLKSPSSPKKEIRKTI